MANLFEQQLESLLDLATEYTSPKLSVDVEDPYNLTYSEFAAQLRGKYYQPRAWKDTDPSFVHPSDGKTYYKVPEDYMDSIFSMTFAENVEKPFINRILTAEPRKLHLTEIDEDGEEWVVTHKMASSDNIVYPTVVRDPDNPNELVDLIAQGADPYKYAITTGNYIEFNHPTQDNNLLARLFAKNYKKYVPGFLLPFSNEKGWDWQSQRGVSDEDFVHWYLMNKPKNIAYAERINEDFPVGMRALMPEGSRHSWNPGFWEQTKYDIGYKLESTMAVMPSLILGQMDDVFQGISEIIATPANIDYGELGSAFSDILWGKGNGFDKLNSVLSKASKQNKPPFKNGRDKIQEFYVAHTDNVLERQKANPRFQAFNAYMEGIRDKDISDMDIGAFVDYAYNAMSSPLTTYGPALATFVATKNPKATMAVMSAGAFAMEATDEWRSSYDHWKKLGFSDLDASKRAHTHAIAYGAIATYIERKAFKAWAPKALRKQLDLDKEVLWNKLRDGLSKIPKIGPRVKNLPDVIKQVAIRPGVEYITEAAQRLSQGAVETSYKKVDFKEVYEEAKEEGRAGAVASILFGVAGDIVINFTDTRSAIKRHYSSTDIVPIGDEFDIQPDIEDKATVNTSSLIIDSFMGGDHISENSVGSEAMANVESIDFFRKGGEEEILAALTVGGEEAIINAGYTIDAVLDALEDNFGDSVPDIRDMALEAIKSSDATATPIEEEESVKPPITAQETPVPAAKEETEAEALARIGLTVQTTDVVQTEEVDKDVVVPSLPVKTKEETSKETSALEKIGLVIQTADDFSEIVEDVPTEEASEDLKDTDTSGNGVKIDGYSPSSDSDKMSMMEKMIESEIQDAINGKRSAKEAHIRINSLLDTEGMSIMDAETLRDYIVNRVNDGPTIGNNKESFGIWRKGETSTEEAPVKDIDTTKYEHYKKKLERGEKLNSKEAAEWDMFLEAGFPAVEAPAISGFNLQEVVAKTINKVKDVTLPRGYKHYKIKTDDGIKIVAGKPIKLNGTNREFFLTKRDDGVYNVTDARTGLFMGREAHKIQKDAIEDAQIILNDKIEDGTWQADIVKAEKQMHVKAFGIPGSTLPSSNFFAIDTQVPVEMTREQRDLITEAIEVHKSFLNAGSETTLTLEAGAEEGTISSDQIGPILTRINELEQQGKLGTVGAEYFHELLYGDDTQFQQTPERRAQKLADDVNALLDEQDSGFPLISDADEQFQKIITKLKKDFPEVVTLVLEHLYDQNGIEVSGFALESLVAWSNSKATLDTAPHEYFHVFFNALKHVAEIDGNAAVKKLIDGGLKEFGWNEEELVQRVAELYTEKVLTDNKGVVDKSLTARLKTWVRKMWNAIKKFFGQKVKGKTYAEQLADIFFNAKKELAIVGKTPSEIVKAQKRINVEGSARYEAPFASMPGEQPIDEAEVISMQKEEDREYAKYTIGTVLAMQQLARLSAIDYSVRPLEELDKKFNVRKYSKGIVIDSDFIRAITKRLSNREYQLIRKIVDNNDLMGKKMSIEDFKAIVISYYFPLRIQRGVAKLGQGRPDISDATSQIFTDFALDDYNDDYGEWSFKVPIIVRQSHPFFTRSDNNTIGWFRGDSNPQNTREFRLQEIQSDTFQRFLKTITDLTTFEKKLSDLAILQIGTSKEELAIQNEFLQNIGTGSWEKFLLNSVLQFLNNNGYSSVLLPTGVTVKEIQNFDKIEAKLDSLPREIEVQKAIVDELKNSPELAKTMKEFKALVPKIRKLFDNDKLQTITAVNEGAPHVWTYNKDIDGWTVQFHYEPSEPISKEELSNSKLWKEIETDPYNYQFTSFEARTDKSKDSNKAIQEWEHKAELDQPGTRVFWDSIKEEDKLFSLERDLNHYASAKTSANRIVARYDMFKTWILKNRKGYSETYTDDKGRTWVRTWLTEKDSLAVPMYQVIRPEDAVFEDIVTLIDNMYEEMVQEQRRAGVTMAHPVPVGEFRRSVADRIPDRAIAALNEWANRKFPNGLHRLIGQSVKNGDGSYPSQAEFDGTLNDRLNEVREGLSELDADNQLQAKEGHIIETIFLSDLGVNVPEHKFAQFMNDALEMDFDEWSYNSLPKNIGRTLFSLGPRQKTLLKKLYSRSHSMVETNLGNALNNRNNLVLNLSFQNGLFIKGPANPWTDDTHPTREQKMIYEVANPDMKSNLFWLNDSDIFEEEENRFFGAFSNTLRKSEPLSQDNWAFLDKKLSQFVYPESNIHGLVIAFARSEKGRFAFAAIKQEHLDIASDKIALKEYWASKDISDEQRNNFMGYRDGKSEFDSVQWRAGEIARFEAYEEMMPLSEISNGPNFFKRISIATTPIFTSPMLESTEAVHLDFNNITFVDKNGIEQPAVSKVLGFTDKKSGSDGTGLASPSVFRNFANAFGNDYSRKTIKPIIWTSDLSLAAKLELQLVPELNLYENYGTKKQKLIASIDNNGEITMDGEPVGIILSNDEAKIFSKPSGEIFTIEGNEMGLISYSQKHAKAKHFLQWYNFIDDDAVINSFNSEVLPSIKSLIKRIALISGRGDLNAQTILDWLRVTRSDNYNAPSNILVEKNEAALLGEHPDNESMLNILLATQVVVPALSTSFSKGMQLHASPDWTNTLAIGEANISWADALEIRKAYAAFHNISEKALSKGADIKELNKWLKNNPFKLVISRSPIANIDGIITAAITELHDRAGQIVINTGQGYRSLEFDFDGDTLQGSVISDDFYENIQNALDKAAKDGRIQSIDLNKYVSDAKLYSDLSIRKNAYMLAEVFSVGARAIGEISNVQAVHGMMKYSFRAMAVNSDKHGTEYIKLKEFTHKEIFEEGELGEKLSIETIIRIWQQAALDNGKFLLLHKWGYTQEKLLRKLFIKGYWDEASGTLISTDEITDEEWAALKPLVNLYKMPARIRNGGTFDNRWGLDELLKESIKYHNFALDRELYYNSEFMPEDKDAGVVQKVYFDDKGLMPMESIAVALSELWNEVGEDGKINFTKFEPEIYQSVHLQTMNALQGLKGDLVDAMAEDYSKQEIIAFGKEGQEYAADLQRAMVEALTADPKPTGGINIPFTANSINSIRTGAKTKTSRTKKFTIGGTFQIDAKTYVITDIQERTMDYIINNEFKAEGYGSPNQLRTAFKKHGFNMNNLGRTMYLHTFKEFDKDSWNENYAGNVGPQSWGRNETLIRLHEIFADRFKEMHEFGQYVATFLYLEGMHTINDNMEVRKGKNRNVLPPFKKGGMDNVHDITGSLLHPAVMADYGANYVKIISNKEQRIMPVNAFTKYERFSSIIEEVCL